MIVLTDSSSPILDLVGKGVETKEVRVILVGSSTVGSAVMELTAGSFISAQAAEKTTATMFVQIKRIRKERHLLKIINTE